MKAHMQLEEKFSMGLRNTRDVRYTNKTQILSNDISAVKMCKQ